MITGRNHDLSTLRNIGRLSPISMFKIIQFLTQKSAIVNMKQPQTNVSDRASDRTGRTLSDATNVEHHGGMGNTSLFDDFLASAYYVERFLDFAYMAFDEVDYSMIREQFCLPKKAVKEQAVLNCDCNDHRKKVVHSDDEGTRNFWRTLDKLMRCAEKLKLNKNPSEVLSLLNAASRVMGCQRILLFEIKLIC